MGIEPRYDVVVVGAGNAGLSAALSAAEGGSSVLVLEKAPEHLRGGNSYFTGGLFRFAYDGIDDIVQLLDDVSEKEIASIDVGKYPDAGFYADVMRLAEGLSDPELLHVLVSRSYPTVRWLKDRGVRWALALGRQAFKRRVASGSGEVSFWRRWAVARACLTASSSCWSGVASLSSTRRRQPASCWNRMAG